MNPKPKEYVMSPLMKWALVSLALMSCTGDPPNSGPLRFELMECLSAFTGSQPELSCVPTAQEGAPIKGCLIIEGTAVDARFTTDGELELTDEARALLEAQIRYNEGSSLPSSVIALSDEGEFSCLQQEADGPCDPSLGCVVKGDITLYAEGSRVSPLNARETCLWSYGDVGIEELCDDEDNDCDGSVDEGFDIGARCSNQALGVCLQEGVIDCFSPTESGCYIERPDEPSEELCDGLDNDCDGATDESFPEQSEGCHPTIAEGLGEAEGRYVCVEAALRCVTEERCDELDNDLDGLVDEGFGVGEACTPDEISCYSRTGQIKCVTPERLSLRIGELYEAACVPDEITRVEEGLEDCDGLDNDCDGFTDEGFVEQVTSCGAGVCANTNGRLRCIEGEIVDDCSPQAPQGSDDDCNGLDDDCDGSIDESFVSYTTQCEGLVGECSRTTMVFCVNRQLQYSCPEVTPPQAEDLRCDGLDEDCDGLIDESFVPREVTCGQGVCQQTVLSSCEEGVELLRCEPGEPLGADDTCDGQDDDCDGSLDESYTRQSYSCWLGACQQEFLTRCVLEDGVAYEDSSCPPQSPIPPQDERCDGLDNDCDGIVDEELPEQASSCGLGLCAATGLISCTEGALLDSCSPALPTEGVIDDCDGLDNDCDGRVDEGFIADELACGPEACQEIGYTRCLAGVVSSSCDDPLDLNNPETDCDGIDQDCDGSIDEHYVSVNTSCGLGLCASSGSTYCQFGLEGDSCQEGTPSGADTSCDGFDQDCDGLIDEGFIVTAVTCGVGVCARVGVKTCSAALVVDSCVPGDPTADDADCNQLDDDCDGSVDEGFVESAVSCGLGVCASTGSLICTPNGVQDTCVTEPPTGADNSCDGLDQDCDGEIDEAFVGVLRSCGQGECSNTAREQCLNGSVIDVCVPSAPQGPDDSCNQLDEDCDGSLDEGFVGALEDCGPDSCEPSAQQLCTQSGVASTCSYQASPTDESCNGVDEDCDGLVDEDYTPPSTSESCGLGVCERPGAIACLNGSAQLVCEPGEPQGADDEACDGLDEDCDGLVDESYLRAVSCGQGACLRSVVIGCDQSQDDCVPGLPKVERCGDAIDNDCDGDTDEGYDALGESCTVGLGVCARTGVLVCDTSNLSGPPVCDVQAGQPGAERCDLLDNDCDGVVDEEVDRAGDSCLRPEYEGSSCHQGSLVCDDGIFSCVGINPGERAENYCTAIDEDCLPETPAQVTYNNKTLNVPYQGGVYDIQLGTSCALATNCYWLCLNGVELSCSSNGRTCTPDIP